MTGKALTEAQREALSQVEAGLVTESFRGSIHGSKRRVVRNLMAKGFVDRSKGGGYQAFKIVVTDAGREALAAQDGEK